MTSPNSNFAIVVTLDGQAFLGIPEVGRIIWILTPDFAQALFLEIDEVKRQLKDAWNDYMQRGRKLSAYELKSTRSTVFICGTITIMPNGDIKGSDCHATYDAPRMEEGKIIIPGDVRFTVPSACITEGDKKVVEFTVNQQSSLDSRRAGVVVSKWAGGWSISCEDGGPMTETSNADGSKTYTCG